MTDEEFRRELERQLDRPEFWIGLRNWTRDILLISAALVLSAWIGLKLL